MSKKKLPLTLDQIKELIPVLKENFEFIRILKQKNNIAEYIQNPKVPPVLSESLVLHLLKNKAISLGMNVDEVIFKGKKCDLEVISKDKKYKIGVKGTGSAGFISLSEEEDLKCDFIIWIHFHNYFVEDQKEIEVYVIKDPSKISNLIKPEKAIDRLRIGQLNKIKSFVETFNVSI